MDKDLKKNLFMDMDKDFEAFWQAYRPDEIRFPNRKQATYQLWQTRLPATQKAMLAYVKDNVVPKWKNPYFFVYDFRDPDPTNYNGARSFPSEPLVRAIYNGIGGIYTRQEAEDYGMEIKGDFKL